MKAEIIGEDEEDIGTKVIDNTGVEHQIEMHKNTGEIYAHLQDGYPDDPSQRTPEGNEHVEQARNYARWYVYQHRDYDTLPEWRNPDRIAATLMTIREFSHEEFTSWFGDLYQQCRSHVDESVQRPIPLEEGARAANGVYYDQQVSLEADLDTLRGVHEELGQQIGEIVGEAMSQLSAEGLLGGGLDTIHDRVRDRSGEVGEEKELPRYEFASVSGIGYRYRDSTGNTQRVEPENDSFESEADARLEVMGGQSTETPEQFQALLLGNLMCQIRDVYLRMGEEPPPPYRVLGAGFIVDASLYKRLEMYPSYSDTSATIPGYSV